MDALPLVGERMTGIGYCQAGQLQALAAQHPEDTVVLQYFSRKNEDVKQARLAPYLRENTMAQGVHTSGYFYRLVTSFLPFPSYRRYFGKDADVTHFFNYIVPPGVSGKTIVTVHDMVYRAFPETVRGRTKWMLEIGLKRSMCRADRIVTDSVFSKEEILRYFPQYAEKIRVVPCGVDAARFHPVDDPETIRAVRETYGIDRDYFLYLGTVEPRKNLERLVDAYHCFCAGKDEPPLLVLAGGKGWLDSGIYQKVKDLRLEQSVLFTAYVPDAEIPALLCGALAFVFPSIYEGFGMPPLEAMSCGVPVLTSTAASLPEMVGDAALLVDPYQVDAIADGLQQLYTDSALRQQLRTAGRKRTAELTWERAADTLYNVYREVVCDA